jgi:hypothetical protein
MLPAAPKRDWDEATFLNFLLNFFLNFFSNYCPACCFNQASKSDCDITSRYAFML